MKAILFFLLFAFVSCEAQMSTIAPVMLQRHPGEDSETNASSQQGVLLIGDSMISYSADNVAGPTPSANTVFEYDGASIVQVATGYLINSGNAGTDRGDPWPRMGIDYFNATGKKLVFVDAHKYNSTLYKPTASPTLNWIYSTSFTKDGLYTTMKTKADNALVALGVSKFKGIIINLTTNDITGSDLITDVYQAYDSLISYLSVDYPNTNIYIITPANPTQSTTQTARSADIRYNISTLPLRHQNTYVAYNAMYGLTLGYLDAAPPHMEQAFNNAQGASLALYLLDTETDGDVRRITNMFFNPITSTKKSAIRTAILALKAAGCWERLNYFLAPAADNYENLTMEWTGNVSPYNVVGGWTFESGYVRTNGSTTYQQLFYVPSLHTRKGGLNDFLAIEKVIDNQTAAGTLASIFGTNSSYIVKQLSNSTLRYHANDATNTDTGLETAFQDNTWYGVARNSSTNKILIRGSTTLHNATVTSTALSTGRQSRGCQAIGSTEFINATHGAFAMAQYSGFDIATFESIIDTLEAALLP